MITTRREIWSPETRHDGWSDTLEWYARAVAVLQERPIADRTSWRFLAAMHGIIEQRWRDFGIIRPGEPLPDADEQAIFWNQCQHSSWYFLPWHRGYLSAFERIVRKAVVGLGGPEDWALPYWNYNKPATAGEIRLPPCFQSPTLPGGGRNPLHSDRRYGIRTDGTFARIGESDRDLVAALSDEDFEGIDQGIHAGFGGPVTGFNHLEGNNGLLERTPHGILHVRIGGQTDGPNPDTPIRGLMSSVKTAGLDPVFWIHHANIDRLWEVWLRRMPGLHRNPDAPDWLDGPGVMERQFAVPDTDGRSLRFVPRDMLDTRAPHLGYEYDDTSDPLGGLMRFERRLFRLGVADEERLRIASMEKVMKKRRTAELMGANDTPIRLGAQPVSARLDVDGDTTLRFRGSFKRDLLAEGWDAEPDRVFLNLENVRGRNEAAIFKVFVSIDGREGAPPADHEVGSFSMFGIEDHLDRHDPNGMDVVFEITHILEAAGMESADPARLHVRIEPDYEVYGEDDVSVGRIGLYRQGR